PTVTHRWGPGPCCNGQSSPQDGHAWLLDADLFGWCRDLPPGKHHSDEFPNDAARLVVLGRNANARVCEYATDLITDPPCVVYHHYQGTTFHFADRFPPGDPKGVSFVEVDQLNPGDPGYEEPPHPKRRGG